VWEGRAGDRSPYPDPGVEAAFLAADTPGNRVPKNLHAPRQGCVEKHGASSEPPPAARHSPAPTLVHRDPLNQHGLIAAILLGEEPFFQHNFAARQLCREREKL